MSDHVKAITRLRDGWPREELPDRALLLYGERLARFPAALVLAAVNDLVDTCTFRPSIGQVIDRVAERALNLPTTEEAWEIAERGVLRNAQEPVRRAVEFVGGRWAIRHGENATTVRAQFRQAYEGYRRAALSDFVTGGRPALAGAERLALSPTMEALPVTAHFYPRPVAARFAARMAGRTLPMPTDAERADAILVLKEGPMLHDDPITDPLYAEAERIFAEAGS